MNYCSIWHNGRSRNWVMICIFTVYLWFGFNTEITVNWWSFAFHPFPVEDIFSKRVFCVWITSAIWWAAIRNRICRLRLKEINNSCQMSQLKDKTHTNEIYIKKNKKQCCNRLNNFLIIACIITVYFQNALCGKET